MWIDCTAAYRGMEFARKQLKKYGWNEGINNCLVPLHVGRILNLFWFSLKTAGRENWYNGVIPIDSVVTAATPGQTISSLTVDHGDFWPLTFDLSTVSFTSVLE